MTGRSHRRPDNHYRERKLAAIYDVTCGWSKDRDFYLSLADRPDMDILDLGCGTGLLCDAYAALGHHVVGLDPAPAMLEVARQKRHGSLVEWIESFSQDFQSNKRFDLIIMTGHAFQVLLEPADICALFVNVRNHLKPNGLFAFESRYPAIDWAKVWHGKEGNWLDDAGDFRMTTEVFNSSHDEVSFTHSYTFESETLRSESTLRFHCAEDIQTFLEKSGLGLTELLGDWDRTPFVQASSEEMIFLVRPDS